MSGSKRVFTHDTFSEVRWRRNADNMPKQPLQKGFLVNVSVLTLELITILEDLQALRVAVEYQNSGSRNGLPSIEIHRVQASIESRLFFHQEQARNLGAVTECCRIATYICSYCVFTDIWDGHIVPNKLSKQLGELLLEIYLDSCWVEHLDMLFWILFVGAIFADPCYRQSTYVKMIRRVRGRVIVPFTEWEDMRRLLEDFIWFDNVYRRTCRYLWDEVKCTSELALLNCDQS